MVLAGRPGVVPGNVFDGTTDVVRFFFFFENVAARNKTDEEKTLELLGYLDGAAATFFFESFASDGALSEDGKDFSKVKQAFLDQYKPLEPPQDVIFRATNSSLDPDDLLSSMRDLDRLYDRAGFNDAAKFGVLRNCVIAIPELAQFAAYRGVRTYEDLKTAIHDFATSRVTFGQFMRNPLLFTSQIQSQVQSPAAEAERQTNFAMESKVDELADQLKELTLMVKNIRTPDKPAVTESKPEDRTCSYCRKPGHTANRCEANPYKTTRCNNCGKLGHPARNCWAPRKDTTQHPAATSVVVKGESSKETKPDLDATQVSLVELVTPEEDIVAITKRTADGEPLPKQPRTNEEEEQRPMDDTPSQPSSSMPQVQMVPTRHVPRTYALPKEPRNKTNRKTGKAKRKTTKKEKIHDHVGKYNLITEFANASSGLTFGQLLRGDATEATKMIRKLFARPRATPAAVAEPISRNQKILRVVNVRVYGTDCSALLDSGAVPNIISHALAEKLALAPTETHRRIRVADGSITPCLGFLSDVPLTFDDLTVYADFLVVRGPPFDVIVGIDLLTAINASLDFGRQMVRVSQNGKKARLPLQTDCIRITENTEDTDSEDFTSDSDAAIDYDGDESSSEEEFVLTIASPQPYEPDSAMSVPQDSVPQDLSHEGLQETDDDVDFTDLPDLMDIDAAYPTSSEEDLELVEEDSDDLNDPEYDPEHTNNPFGSNSSSSDEDINLSLPAAMATPWPEKKEQTTWTEEQEHGEPEGGEQTGSQQELTSRLAHLPREAQEILFHALGANDIVAWTLDDLRPASVPFRHGFELTDEVPIHFRSRRLSPRHQAIVREELDRMLEAGIIKPSVSAWSFPVVIVQKKDGKPRFCVDYRTLNQKMKADRWPLPKIEEIFDDLKGSTHFTTLDLFSGYWQVRLREDCKEKTTFVCRYGTYQFEVMPFGLMNAPSTFQRMMDQVFRHLDFVRVYLDDVVVFSESLETHMKHLNMVFTTIAEAGLKIKVSKCAFAHSSVRLLGHIVTKDGLEVDPDKTAAIQRFPEPRTKTDLRSFLGLAGYYRRFVQGFAGISATLHAATSTTLDFTWTPQMSIAFQDLKQRLVSPPVLALPDFDQPFIVETDASNVALGAVLAQKCRDGAVHPIQYASRTLTPAERNYSACEREALAVVFALKKFRVYLLSDIPFTVITDHRALQYAFQKQDIHGRLARWLDFLAEYDYKIQYRPGKVNAAADFLSRLDGPQETRETSDILAVATESETIMFDLLEPSCQEVARYLQGQPLHTTDQRERRAIRRNSKHFLIWAGRLFRRTPNGIRAIPDIPTRVPLLKSFHDNIGHWDHETTRQFTLDRYWWPRVHKDIYEYVRSCHNCQLMRPILPYRTTLHVPLTNLFDTFSIDVCGPTTSDSSR